MPARKESRQINQVIDKAAKEGDRAPTGKEADCGSEARPCLSVRLPTGGRETGPGEKKMRGALSADGRPL
jgi:hypothetical protein